MVTHLKNNLMRLEPNFLIEIEKCMRTLTGHLARDSGFKQAIALVILSLGQP